MHRTWTTRTPALLLAGLMALLLLAGCGRAAGVDAPQDLPDEPASSADTDTDTDTDRQPETHEDAPSGTAPDADAAGDLPAENTPGQTPEAPDAAPDADPDPAPAPDADPDPAPAPDPAPSAPPVTPVTQPEPPQPAAPDQNGMMQVGDTGIQDPGTLDTASISGFADKLKTLRDKYLQPAASVAYAVIPDKSHYAAGRITASLSHDEMMGTLRPLLEGWNEIEFGDLLTLEDYLLTDGHWRQERLIPLADRIAAFYGFSVSKGDFTQKSQSGFGGDYSKYMGVTETICWMESRHTASAVCDNFQNPDRTAVYDSALLQTGSPYDLFSGGPTPLVTIRDPENTGGRRLILFRDSFGSSLAPLLLGGYSEIVLVDLRYMVSDLLPQYVDFTDADILFLYSARVVNNSRMLR